MFQGSQLECAMLPTGFITGHMKEASGEGPVLQGSEHTFQGWIGTCASLACQHAPSGQEERRQGLAHKTPYLKVVFFKHNLATTFHLP